MRQLKRMHLIDAGLHGRAGSYLFQSTLAALALLLILTVEVGVGSAAINSAIASSAFLVFVVPHSVASSSRRLLGGHVVGVIVGASAYFALRAVVGETSGSSSETMAVAGAIGVGVSILLMAVTNTEHPPAAGTTLGLITDGADAGPVWFILSAAVLLAVIRLVLAPRLVNLLGMPRAGSAGRDGSARGGGDTDG